MKALARLLSVVLLGSGAGLLAYCLLVDQQSFRAPFGWDRLFATPTEVLAWGIGFLVGGLLLLLLFGVRRNELPPLPKAH